MGLRSTCAQLPARARTHTARPGTANSGLGFAEQHDELAQRLREKESDLEAYEAELRNSSLRDEAGESAFAAKQAELNRQRLQMHEKLDAILQSNSQYHHQIKSTAQKQATASQSLRQCEATVRGESASIHC